MKDWREFRLRVFVDRSQEAVFSAWVRSGELERWFLTKAEYYDKEGKPLDPAESAVRGCTYRWEWVEGTIEKGSILTSDGFGSLAFSFGDGCTVALTLARLDGRTAIELLQSHVMTDVDRRERFYVDCLQGWTFYLANLKSVLEGGLDLREKEPVGAHLVNV
ncbi:MAG: SRPBCC domain-containing protein [Fimbriimonas ginsengisoli]|uniref:SRPBCC domain-containing protein n=1 Tax=Fimbriimonas ginsengisoli TaxID=1005039 RepID=A0A931PTE8_FIMGI|nr:SRPBCC domain-containing protein [Fimbriimonas ginsengisoli]MBI3743909.1 SRPBCC domain-containing protein [Chloroflexota bacterium]